MRLGQTGHVFTPPLLNHFLRFNGACLWTKLSFHSRPPYPYRFLRFNRRVSFIDMTSKAHRSTTVGESSLGAQDNRLVQRSASEGATHE